MNEQQVIFRGYLTSLFQELCEKLLLKENDFYGIDNLIPVVKYLYDTTDYLDTTNIKQNKKDIDNILMEGIEKIFTEEYLIKKISKMNTFDITKKMAQVNSFINKYKELQKKDKMFKVIDDNYKISFYILSLLDEIFIHKCIDYLMIEKHLSTYDINLFMRQNTLIYKI